ncbi:MAG: sensor histidine kinase [Planctomycetota bacterium]
MLNHDDSDQRLLGGQESKPLAAERVRINMWWLLKLRRAAVVGQLITILVVERFFDVPLRLPPLMVLILLGLVANLLLQLWYFRSQDRGGQAAWLDHGRHVLGAVLVFDLVLLMGLLYFSGGATNPFSGFFFVNLMLGAVVLGGGWLQLLAAAAALSYAVLLLFHVPLPEVGAPLLNRSTEPGLDQRIYGLTLYAWGSLASFLAISLISVYFVRRLIHELRDRERLLELERQRRADALRLEALANLAAGAAHELASPLSTIAVVARDLESGEGVPEEDAQLIRREVGRCRKILDQMSLDAGDTVGEELVDMLPMELVSEALSKLEDTERVSLELDDELQHERLRVPRTATVRAVRALIKNALDASEPDTSVRVELQADAQLWSLVVRDQGRGMDPQTLERAGDPFFTTKDPGRGMGLGLFLVRTLADRLGGELRLASTPGRGTVARLEVPRRSRALPGADASSRDALPQG